MTGDREDRVAGATEDLREAAADVQAAADKIDEEVAVPPRSEDATGTGTSEPLTDGSVDMSGGGGSSSGGTTGD